MIEPLGRGTLLEAMALVNRVFPLQTEDERSDFWLPKSLEWAEEHRAKARELRTEDSRP